MGLILVPLVEKAAEHLTAVDEAWDNQMNFALAHVLGATIQTALFNGPLAVIVGWGLGRGMDFNFETFNIVVLILAVIVVGNFLRDQKSNYLEGALCILVYMLIGKLFPLATHTNRRLIHLSSYRCLVLSRVSHSLFLNFLLLLLRIHRHPNHTGFLSGPLGFLVFAERSANYLIP